MDAVPFILYDSAEEKNGIECFDEANAAATGLYLPKGEMLMDLMLK